MKEEGREKKGGQNQERNKGGMRRKMMIDGKGEGYGLRLRYSGAEE